MLFVKDFRETVVHPPIYHHYTYSLPTVSTAIYSLVPSLSMVHTCNIEKLHGRESLGMGLE